jgi:hypothetical protein
MGNVLGENNSGVIQRGNIIMKNCIRCNKPFQTEDGIITIKGKTPPHEFCKECDKINFDETIESLRKSGWK